MTKLTRLQEITIGAIVGFLIFAFTGFVFVIFLLMVFQPGEAHGWEGYWNRDGKRWSTCWNIEGERRCLDQTEYERIWGKDGCSIDGTLRWKGLSRSKSIMQVCEDGKFITFVSNTTTTTICTLDQWAKDGKICAMFGEIDNPQHRYEEKEYYFPRRKKCVFCGAWQTYVGEPPKWEDE